MRDATTTLEIRRSISVRWRDLDFLGHLNQAVYHEYLEEGRGALLEALQRRGDFFFVLARVELDHRQEVRRDHGAVDVVARVASTGRSSIVVEHAVLLPDGAVAAEGRSVLVAWDRDARCSRALTDEERALLGAGGR